MSGKLALIIGNTEYTDPGLSQLTAPGKDAEDFARVLKDQDICAFDDVHILLNEPSFVVAEAMDAFFYEKKPDDLLIVYFSGHGVRDEFGTLYLAVKNTNRSRLRATAIRSDHIREAMDQSRSKRQVLILDCCNSGAFPQGTKAQVGGTMGMLSALQGYGRYVLTASDATQFAWEGNQVIGETENSLFTHFLVKGLEGDADLDADGQITVDELYDYAFEMVKFATPKQTPSKFSSSQQGEIVLRQNIPIEEIKPVTLPADLLEAIENSFTDVRLGAVQQLTKLLKGKNLGLARSARAALSKIAAEDDSHRVAKAAGHVLETHIQEERIKREAARKARHENLREQATKVETTGPVRGTQQKTHYSRKSLRVWAFAAGIVGGLSMLLWVLFLPVNDKVLSPFPTATIELTVTMPIVFTFTPSPTHTASQMATTTSMVTMTNTEFLFSSPQPTIPAFPPTRISMPIPTITPTHTPISPPATPTPTNTAAIPTVNSCGPLLTRVTVGITIQVTTSGKVTTLGIRPEPKLEAHRTFELLPGDKMTVLSGPMCSDNSYFYYISSEKGNGWVREGNGEFYFVEPFP